MRLFVLAEALNFIRMKVKRAETAEALVTLASGSETFPPLFQSVSRVHSARLATALGRYRKEFDRGLSLTGWTSVVVAQDEGLDEIATFNDGFRSLLHVVGR